MRSASQNPYPLKNQNLGFSQTNLWPDQTFDRYVVHVSRKFLEPILKRIFIQNENKSIFNYKKRNKIKWHTRTPEKVDKHELSIGVSVNLCKKMNKQNQVTHSHTSLPLPEWYDCAYA